MKITFFRPGRPRTPNSCPEPIFLLINNTQNTKPTKGGQIQPFKEAKIHWKCSVRKDMEDPVQVASKGYGNLLAQRGTSTKEQ